MIGRLPVVRLRLIEQWFGSFVFSFTHLRFLCSGLGEA
jgi:hypothetical protein